MGYDYRLERPGYDPFPQRDLGILVYSMTRPLLEFTVRKRLAAAIASGTSQEVSHDLPADGRVGIEALF